MNDDLLNFSNWSPPGLPFGANIVFNGTSAANARWEPASSVFGTDLAVNSLTMDGYGGTLTIQAVSAIRESNREVDSGTISAIGNININGGNIIIRNTSFAPTIQTGEIRSEAFLRTTQGSLSFSAGTIRIIHVTANPNLQFSYVGLEIPLGDFNWSGGTMILDAQEGTAQYGPIIRLGRNWNQTTPNYPALQGEHGLLELNGDPLIGVTQQVLNGNGAALNAATTPAVRVGLTVPAIIPANSSLHALAAIDRTSAQAPGTSLIIALQTCDFQAFNNESILLGGVSIGPFQEAVLQMGAGRRIRSGGFLAITGGNVNATNGNGLDFQGSLLFDFTLGGQDPPATMTVSGGGSYLRLGGYRVMESNNNSLFNLNLGGVGEFRVGGNNFQADFVHTGNTNVILPSIINLAGPANSSFDSFWSANAETNVFPEVIIRSPNYLNVPEGSMKFRNPPPDAPLAPHPAFDMSVGALSLLSNFADPARLEVLDGRIIDVTNQEIFNSGIITLTNGRVLRPTLSIQFTDREGNPQSLYAIGRDQVYVTIKDSDKNLNGVNVFDTLPSVTFELFNSSLVLQETEVFDQGSGELARFLETGILNYTFRNRANGLALLLRSEGAPINNNGELRAEGGDILRVTYIDPNGSGGPCCAEVIIPNPVPPPPPPPGAPDLIIEDCDVAATLTEAVFTARICNVGTEDVNVPFELGIYYNSSGPPTTGTTPDVAINVGVDAGGPRTLTVTPGANVGDGSVANPMASGGPLSQTWTLTCITDSVDFAAGGTNVGNGTLTMVASLAAAVDETWTLTCTDITTLGAEVFSVTGSVSGAQANATTGALYSNTFVRFMINAGATAFAVGDTFTITVLGAGAEVFSVVGSISGAQANATVDVPYNNGLISFTIGAGAAINYLVGDSFTITAEAISLAAGQCIDIQHTLPNPPQGNFEGWFWVDHNNIVPEQDENNNLCGAAFYSVQPGALPDLTFQSFVATAIGSGASFTLDVINQGNANSAPCILRLSYEGNPQTDPNAVTTNVPALNAGENVVINMSRSNAPDGTYIASAFVDSTTIIAESNEANNTISSNPYTTSGGGAGALRVVTFSSLGADLVPITIPTVDANGLGSGVTQFTRSYPTTTTAVMATAPTTHNGAAFQRWFDPINNVQISPIEQATITIADGAIARAEYAGGGGGNLPDLIISSFTASTGGTSISFSVTARNAGNANSGACQLAIFYEQAGNPSPPGGDAFISIPALVPGGTHNANHLFSGAALGDYTPRAFVDNTLTVTESVESNNESLLTSGSTTITVDGSGGQPDLTISAFTATAMGLNTSYQITVVNQGLAASTATNLTLSYDGGPQVDDSTSVPALNASQSMVFNFNRTNAPPGTYVARAMVDAALSVAESNENNNTANSNSHTNTDTGPGSGNRVSFSAALANLVPIGIDTLDINGMSDGVTNFTREFDVAVTSIVATAPATHGGANFLRWFNVGTGTVVTTNPAATLAVSDGASYRAEYEANPGNPQPDLTISSFTVQLVGSNIQFSVRAQNLGNAPAGASTLALYFNLNGTPSPAQGDVEFGVGALAAGATSAPINFTLPNAPAGLYLPEAFIDSRLVVTESAESNNRTGPTSAPTTITAPGPSGGEQPDLTITTFQAVALGSDTTYTIIVSNLGAASSAACRLDVSFNGDAVVNAMRAIPALIPGGNTTQVVMRTGAPPGTYVSTATVDAGATVTESNEANNTASSNSHTNTAVGPGSGKTVTFTSALAPAVPITIDTLDLNGNGDGVTTFVRQFDNAVNTFTATAPASHAGVNFLRWFNVTAGTVVTTTPAATLTATDGVTYRAEYEANPGNPQPDLTFSAFTIQLVGANINFSATAQNLGNAASTASTLALYFNLNGSPSPVQGDVEFPIGALAPGATAAVNFTLPNAPAGLYTPEVFIDSRLVVTESDETNNRMGPTAAPATVTAPGPAGGEQPDLTIDSFLANAAGSNTTYTLQVANQGLASSAACRLDISFNGDGFINAMVAVPGLAPGASANLNAMRTGAAPGTYVSTAFVDAGASVTESNEANNTASSNSHTNTVGPGSGNTASFSSGNADFVPVTLSALDLNGLGDGVTTFVRQYDAGVASVNASVPAVHDGATFQQWFNVTAGTVVTTTPAATLPLSDGIAYRADYLPDAGNPRPDLTISAFSVQLVGANINFAATAQNIGNANSAACSLGLYFNRGGTPSPALGDVEFPVGVLAPGATAQINFSLPNAPAGTYSPEAFVDNRQVVVESAESNNRTIPTTPPVSVTAPGPSGGELPDLTIASFVATALGQGTTYNIVVTNQGAASSAACRLDVSFNGDGSVNASPTVPALAPGANAPLTVFRMNAAPGTYVSTAFVDAGFAVAESDEGNNTASSNSHTNTMVDPGDGQLVTFTAARVTNVPVMVSAADLFGFADGVTDFSRQFADTTNTVVATAPTVHQGRDFERWFDPVNGTVISLSPAATISVAPGFVARAEYEADPANPQPDLVVDRFDVQVASGDLAFSARVTNIGNAAAGASSLAIYYNPDGGPASPANGEQQVATPALAVGASAVVNASFLNAPEGTYRPVAFADIFAAVTESSEGNNASNPTSGDIEGDGSVVVGGSDSDLTIVSFVANAVGQGTTYQVTVQNIGTGDSDPCFLGLSYEGGSTDDTANVPVLAPSATQVFNFIRSNAPPGTYVARATVDLFNQVDELNEGNNVLDSNSHTNTQVNPGDGKTMNFSSVRADLVTLAIDTPDLFGLTDGVTAFTRQFPDPVTSVVATAPAVHMGANFQQWVDATNGTVIAATASATIPVTDGGSVRAEYEANPANPLPDLAIDSFTGVLAGADINFSVRVSNQGNAASTACSLALFYNIVGFPSPGAGDVVLPVGALAPGANAVVNFTFPNAPAGTYVPTAFVDSLLQVVESAESNNTSAMTGGEVTIIAPGSGSQPDLTITSFVAVAAGQSTTYNITVANQGLGASPANLLFVSFNGDAVTNVMEPVPALAAGGSTMLTVFRMNAPAGTYTSSATVDGSFLVAETNEANNFALSNPHTNTLVNPGDGQLVTWVSSGVDALPIFIDTADLLGQTDGFTLFTRQYDDAVTSVVATAPGIHQGVNFQRWVNPSTGLTISTSPMATIPINDGLTVRAEYALDGGNPQPDLVINSFNIDVTGSTITFDVIVQNVGNAASIPCSLALYYNHESIVSPPNGDQLAAIEALAPGAATARLFTLNNAPLGSYMPVAFIDIFFVVDESSEGNNGSAPTSGDVTGGVVDIEGNVFTFTSGGANAVPVTVSMPDLLGQSDGVTDFFREFDVAIPSVTATAPATHQGVNFDRWFNPVAGTVIATTPSAVIPITDGGVARAEYLDNPADPRADLVVQSFTATLLGDDLSYQVTVANLGNASAGASSLALYHNIEDIFSPPTGDAVLAVGALAPGATATRNYVLMSAPAGVYTPVAFIDSLDVVAESAETNNTSFLTGGDTEVTVPPGGGGGGQPDLVVETFTATALGQGTTYDILVRNQGSAASTAACMLGLSYDSNVTFEDATTIPALNPGGTALVQMFRINAPPGIYTARARVDLTGIVAESNESNNDRFSNVHTNTAVDPDDGRLVTFTSAQADFVPVMVSDADLFGETDGVTVFARQFSDTTTTVTASAPSIHSGNFFQRWTVPATGQVLSTTPSVLIPISPDLVVRAEYAGDPGNPLPDLVINAFNVDVTGDTIQSQVTVANVGNAASGACVLALYYNLAGVPSNPAGDDTFAVGALAPGATTVANFTLIAAPPGTYTPLAFVDLNGEVAESSESNNASQPTSGDVTNGEVVIDPASGDQTVTFSSLRATSVPITVDLADLDGQQDGVTTFARRYATSTPSVTATAPATHAGLNFQQWVNPASGAVISASPVAVVALSDGLVARAEYEADPNNPRPDLVINSFSGGVVGVDVVYQLVVANLGNAASAACSLSLSHNIAGFPSPPSGDELLAVGPLAPGATATLDFTLLAAPAGTYTPTAFVDSLFVVAESVENNNASLLTSGLTSFDAPGPGGGGGQQPDLLISSFVADAFGAGTTYTITVENRGNAASAGTSLNLTYNFGGPVDDTATVPLMAAGGSAVLTLVRTGAPAGTYTAFAVVDPANVVAESEENNNAAFSNTHTNTGVDPGEGQLMTFASSNVDFVPVSLDLADLNGETDGVTTFSRLFDDAAASVIATAPAVQAGRNFVRWYDPDRAQVISLSASAVIPIIPGRVARAEYEANPANPLPDLVIDSLLVSINGDDVTFDLTVSNAGNADALLSTLALYYNRVGLPSPPAGDQTTAVALLAPGASTSTSFTLVDAAPGTYRPSAFIDSLDVVAESAETNNTVFATGGDIETDGSFVIDPGAGSPTQLMTFTSLLANALPVTLSAPDLFGESDGVTTFTREYADTVTTISATAPATHQGVNFVRWVDGTNGSVIATTPTADIPVTDGGIARAEYSADPVTPRPDLIVDFFSATLQGSDLVYQIRVTNVGNKLAPSNTLAIFHNIDGFPSPPAGDLTVRVGGLPAGASSIRSARLSSAPAGTYRPLAFIDSLQVVAESSETNNTSQLTTGQTFIETPGPGPGFLPDLTIPSFVATAEGQGTTYQITVANQGNAASLPCKVGLSYDSVRFQRRLDLPALAPGSSTTLTAYRTNAPVGAYVAQAQVDFWGGVVESNETNNLASSNPHTNEVVTGNSGQLVTFSSARVNAVPVLMSVADLLGQTDGTTDFTRQFANDTMTVEATAPGIHQGAFFVRWFDAGTGATISDQPLATIQVVSGLVARVEYTADAGNPLPDLLIDSFVGGASGDDLTFQVEVSNLGNLGSGPCVLALYLNREGFISPAAGDQTIAVEALAPGATTTKTFQVFDAGGGRYEPTVFVDSEEVVVESAETNNISSLTAGGLEIEVPGDDQLPDLSIPTFAAVADGAGTTYTLTIRNSGDAASAPTSVAISYEGDGSFDASRPVPALSAGEEAIVVAFRAGAPAGTYIATALVDPSNGILEANETNNSAASNQHTNTTLGTNEGTLVAFSALRADSVPVTLSAPDQDGLTDGVTFFSRTYGDTVTSVTATAPSIHNGAFFERWFNPVSGQVISTSPSANIPVALGSVARAEYLADPANPLPDLVVDSLTILISDNDMTLNAVVTNGGNAGSAECVLALYLNREGAGSPPAGELNIVVEALAPGATTFKSGVANDLPDGRYLPVAFVDVFSVVTESSETNNVSQATGGDIDTSGTVDLGFADLIIQTFSAVALGQGTTYDLLVRNIGAVGSASCVLGISPDGLQGATVSGPVPALQPNGFARVVLLRQNAPPGTYTAFALVDLNDTVVETNELNNTATSNEHTNTPVDPTDGQRMTFTALAVDDLPVTLDAVDLFGFRDGVTTFERQFSNGTSFVTATAPAVWQGREFVRWSDPFLALTLSNSPEAIIPTLDGRVARAEYALDSSNPQPDLVIDAFEADANGRDISFMVRVSNLGNAPAGANTLALTFNHETNPSNPGGDAFVAAPVLAAGSSATLQYTLMDATAGSYTPRAFIDSANAVAESAEDNNESSLSVGDGVVMVLPDDASRMTFTADRVDNVPVTLNSEDLTGQGSGVTTFTRLYGNLTPTITATAPATHQGRVFEQWFDSLSGQVLTTNRMVTVDVQDGRTLRAQYAADPANPQPDLIVSRFQAEVLGRGALFQIDVTNVGNAPAGPHELALYYDAPSAPSGGTGADQIVSVDALAPGAMASLLVAWEDAPAGSYTPWTFVDSGFVVAESAEGNNASGLDTSVCLDENGGGGNGGGGSDCGGGGIEINPGSGTRTVIFTSGRSDAVAVEVDTYDETGRAGGVTTFARTYLAGVTSITVTAPLTNRGDNFVRWFNGRTGQVITTDPVAVIAPIENGMIIRAEYDGAATGSGPDLVIDRFDVTSDGVDATFSITLRNIGDAGAQAASMAIFEDLASAPTSGFGAVRVVPVPALAPTNTMQIDETVFDILPRGDYKAWGLIDSEDVVLETVESNNVAGPALYAIRDPVDGFFAR